MMRTRLDDVNTRIADLRAFADTLNTALTHLEHLPDRAEPCDNQCAFLQTTSDPTHAATQPRADSGLGIRP